MQRTSKHWTPWRRFFAAAVAFACAGCGSESDRPPPNVILMVIDTLRADHLGGYGYFRDTTPVLDTFIEEGVRFDAAIAPGSWSPPSQISIITGVNPYLHGVNDFGHRIRSPIDPLGTILKRHGYATGLFSSHRALHTSVERSTEGMDHQLVALDRDREPLDDLARVGPDHVTADHPVALRVDDELHHRAFVVLGERVLERAERRPVDIDLAEAFASLSLGEPDAAHGRLAEHR